MVDAAPGAYAHALRREILRSEQKRMRVVAVVLILVLCVSSTSLLLLPELRNRLFPDGIQWWVPLAGVGPFILFEIVALAVLRYRLATGRDFPQPARFANVLVETSMPGAVIYVLARHMEPQLVFGFWPPMLYFVFIVLSTLRLDFWLSLWTGAVAAVQLFVLAVILLPIDPAGGRPDETLIYHFGRSVMLMLAGVAAAIVARTLRQQFENSVAAAAARDRVTNLFGQHVSPVVVEQLLDAELQSAKRTVCVMFLDIRGFTAMTRNRSADETVTLLNDFFAEMIEIVDRNHGFINKFLGDGFLALFGAALADPAAAANALNAGRAMLLAVDGWNQANPGRMLKIGIGIHIGEAVTGSIGSPRRKEYTAIGDTVNLAARLEQLTKETGARLLLSEPVRAAAAASDAIDLGLLAVRGYDEPVRVWRL
ncbi:adenylate/guanylate cyclase domain-containing protein [Reyranella sp.]|uniref:adenylate/guanylate cyclase domain-containing protein n=1 Tax=Reyranella sp. TaxID=1929291 RepID=UPI003D12A837